jgi:hypothetical protein
MSLHDRYNRGDGRIQKLDRYLTHIGDRAGAVWWSWTGWSRRSLTQGLYVLSAAAAIEHMIVFDDPILVLVAAVALLNFIGAGQSRGGLVEQIQAEAAGLPRNALALMRLLVLILGLWHLAIAAGGFFALLTEAGSVLDLLIKPLLLGLALTAFQASDYIRRTNPATPSGGNRGRARLLPPR